MSIPASWAPPNETASDLWQERSNFDSVVLSSTAYGVHLTLYMIVMQHFLNHKVKTKSTWCFMAYITWNFILGTFGISAEAKFNELTFVDARNFPGGPNAFVNAEYSDFINIFGTAAYVVLNWFADGLVIYRFWLIFDFNYYIVVLPSLLLAGSFSMGVILLFQLSQPNANLWTVTTVSFGIPYWSLSTALNILVTSLIVARLLYIRTTIRKILANDYGRTYVSVATMLIESAALYSITALIFIITYARSSNIQNLVLPVLGQVQAISPLLIMWRVAQGNAWTRTTASQITTETKISWAHNETMNSQDLTSKSESNIANRSLSNTSLSKPMSSKRRTKRGSQETGHQLNAFNVPGHRRSNSRHGLTLTTLPVLNEKDTSPRMVNITLPERAQTFPTRRFANIGQTASGNSNGDYEGETEWSPSPIDSAVDRKPLDVPDWTTLEFGYLNPGEKQSDSSMIHHDSDADQDAMRDRTVDGDSLGSGADVDRLRGDSRLSPDVAGKSV